MDKMHGTGNPQFVRKTNQNPVLITPPPPGPSWKPRGNKELSAELSCGIIAEYGIPHYITMIITFISDTNSIQHHLKNFKAKLLSSIFGFQRECNLSLIKSYLVVLL
jgi:hypothetical protein